MKFSLEYKNRPLGKRTTTANLATSSYCTRSYYRLATPPPEETPLPEPTWHLDQDGYPLPETLSAAPPKKKKRRTRRKKAPPAETSDHRSLHYIFCHDPWCPYHR